MFAGVGGETHLIKGCCGRGSFEERALGADACEARGRIRLDRF